MEELPFRRLEAPEPRASGVIVLRRLLDGIGFRFHWATEALRPEDPPYKPTPGSMSMGELVQHVGGLVRWVAESIGVSGAVLTEVSGELKPVPEQFNSWEGFVARRAAVLEMVRLARARLGEMSDPDLERVTVRTRGGPVPWGHLVNGPLADALTHIGQINTMRRSNGNPVPRANVFLGTPPA